MQKQIDFGIKAMIVKDGKYLAVHKANITDPYFELPGGRMQFQETIEDTVIREVKEELNLDIKPIRLLDTWNYLSENYQVAGVIYYCQIVGDDTISLSSEHDAYRWFDIYDMSQMNVLFKAKMEAWDKRDYI